MTDRAVLAIVLFGTVLGAAVRVLPFVGGDFPLNDGGLFYAMTLELQAAGYAIPETTAYNGLEIPYVYPPMAFYVAGLLNDLIGIGLTDLFRILPVVFSVAMIPAFHLVARWLLRPAEAAVATLAFALLPRSWEWMVLGGGITRSLGFLLALLAIAAGVRLFRESGRRWIVATGLLGGATALAHPQGAVFAAVSLLVMLVALGRSRVGVRALVVAALIGILLLSPWLVPVMTRHGLDPLLSARTTGGGLGLGVILFLKLRFTGVPFMDVLGIIGFAGFAVALAQRRWLAPAWLVLILLVDSRGGATYAMAPLAMLVGIAVVAGVTAMRVEINPSHPIRSILARPWVAGAAATLLVMAVATNQGVIFKDDSVLHPVSAEQRQAMAWVSAELPEDARFAVVTGLSHWEGDRVSEWFPVLAERASAATFQGFEWLGVDRWRAQLKAYHELQECGRQTGQCLADWQRNHALGTEYVLIPKGFVAGPQTAGDCCPALRATLEEVGEVLYDGPGGTIARLDLGGEGQP